MVRQGYAWAFVKYSSSYVKEEAAAKAEGLGIWQGAVAAGLGLSRARWATAEPQAPQGCAIKGNVTSTAASTTCPGAPGTPQIRMEPDKGKRWFCTEAEAVAAGWRPVLAH